MFTNPNRNFYLTIFCLILFPINVFSEDGVIEEVLVTATLRVQSAQDTPISMTVIGGDALVEKDLMQISDIARQTPALHISEGTVSNKLFLRGVGSGQDSGIEQSVGTVIDGVYQGRSKATTATLFDIERVEVLKGPQTTYFGNNTIGGALSIITRAPTDTVERSVSGTAASHGERTVQAVLSGPFSEGLKGRLGIQFHSTDGWLKNINPIGEDHPKKDSLIVRGTLLWDSWDDMDISLKAEVGRIDNESGIGWQQTECPPDPARFPAGAVGPFNMCRLGQELIPEFEAEFDENYSGSENQDGYLDADNFVLRINKTFGNHELTSITSLTAFDMDQVGESDESQLPLLHWSVLEDTSQFAQELRLSNATSDKFQYTVGAYFQQTDVDLKVRLGLFNLATAKSVVGFSRNFRQDTDLISVFGSITYVVSDKLHVTPSVRWTDVEKNLNRNVVSSGGSLDFDDFNFDGFEGLSPVLNRDDTMNDSAVTPALNIQYFPGEDSMFYASYSDGFKAGGFEAIPNTNEGAGEFDAESVAAFELGYKTTLNDRIQLSLALFRNEYKDLQTAAYRVPQNPEEFGTAGFWSTTNVKGADVRGLDFEMAFLLTDKLRLDASITILDATFRDFENGFCPIGSAMLTCDKTGSPLPYAPDKSGLVALSYDDEIGNGLNFSSFVSVYFSDGYFHEIDQDPYSWEPSYYKIDARVEVYPDDERWYVALVGKNLNDEYTSNWRTDIFGTTGGFLAILDRTRSIGVQFGYNF